MPRGRAIPSDVFRSVMDTARKQLLLDSEKAAAFKHKGIRGDERAAALMRFFRERLPDTLGIGKGEAIDCEDTRTGQIDFFIYDQARCTPISTGNENLLLPCEAIYCVIEVKTTITVDELKTSYKAAGKVRALKPFQKPFVPARLGANADDVSDRCLYLIFGFCSNLANDQEWTQKEYRRLKRRQPVPRALQWIASIGS